jgi:hypothetical protein
MDSANLFHLLIAIYLLFHGIWWSKRNALNLIIKITFWGFGIWALLLSLNDFGFIIKM